MINGGDRSFYIEHIGLYFFFIACAGVSIIVWIFNWICWINQCCCCDFLHNPVNKRIAWWMSFIFLLGILACCISGCVSVNRFGFALNGAWCAVERIYFDSKNGELLSDPFDELDSSIDGNRWKGTDEVDYSQISDEIDSLKSRFNEAKFDFRHWAQVAKDLMKVLAEIYFCFFIIVVTFSCVSMMFYACLKRQGYLIIIMHFLWNAIRFLMFSFFFYGAAYGFLYHFFRDLIGLVDYIFREGNEYIVPNENTLKKCFTNEEIPYPKLCRVIRRDVNILYWALDDASFESQNLSAISLCSSFFGAVAVYFFLLVMHHYNNEIFFDVGKSIFKGFDGFGGGYKKKNLNQNPAFKKRKLRNEIEMTSNYEQNSNYKNINKNENDDEDN